MTAILDAYSSEYAALCDTIRAQIERLTVSTDHDTIQTLVSEIEVRLIEANGVLKEIEVEVRNLDATGRQDKYKQIKALKKTQADLRTQYEGTIRDKNRTDLIGGCRSAADRERFLTVNDKINRQNDTILSAQRSVAETEEVGVGTIQELSKNREKIDGAQGKATEINSEFDRADAMANSMLKRDKCSIM